MKLWKKIILSLVAFLVLLIGTGVFVGWMLGVPTAQITSARLKNSPQFRDGAFVNIEPQSPTEFTWAQLKEAFGDHPRTAPSGEIPVVPIEPNLLTPEPHPGLRMAWIGHATVLIEIDGKRILTDPVFSERVSPFSFAGPKRFHPTPIKLDALKNIDAVVVTHNHYDHLDKTTVQHLASQGTRFFVPLGNKPQLAAWGVPDTQVEEMEWWQETTLGPLKVIATPSRHYSNRGIFDIKKTLWASWSIIGPQNRVFVSGDTGYANVFSEIGERLGPFDATIIKVGAYGPGASWLDVHMIPEDSMRVHKQVRGKAMLPVHWGTFNLAYHPWNAPIIRAVEAANKEGIQLLTPKIGEMVDLQEITIFEPWWESVD